MTSTQLDYGLYDIVEMKKEHPCNTRSKIFKIVRMGADIKIECQGCKNVIMLTRYNFNKRLKRIVSKAQDDKTD
ncbi:TPA: DUF951 domain-containing protein [bacterium]|jgi:hypothetical protein|nr:DUF951 domain-containing protein [bacterium]